VSNSFRLVLRRRALLSIALADTANAKSSCRSTGASRVGVAEAPELKCGKRWTDAVLGLSCRMPEPTGADLEDHESGPGFGTGLGAHVTTWTDVARIEPASGCTCRFISFLVTYSIAMARPLCCRRLRSPCSWACTTYGKRPADETLAPTFFPRRTRRSGSSRPLRFKKGVRSGAPLRCAQAGSSSLRSP
jgi:hypothetical protein